MEGNLIFIRCSDEAERSLHEFCKLATTLHELLSIIERVIDSSEPIPLSLPAIGDAQSEFIKWQNCEAPKKEARTFRLFELSPK